VVTWARDRQEFLFEQRHRTILGYDMNPSAFEKWPWQLRMLDRLKLEGCYCQPIEHLSFFIDDPKTVSGRARSLFPEAELSFHPKDSVFLESDSELGELKAGNAFYTIQPAETSASVHPRAKQPDRP
jgi:hypothetical protein